MKTSKGLILVVDDEVHIATAMARLLEKVGYEVLVAYDGNQAIELATKNCPQLILCDVILPHISGTEVLTKTKANPGTCNSFVVLMSSRLIESDQQAENMEMGADGYLIKPIQNRELIARVEAFMRHKNAIDRLQQSEDRFKKIVDNDINAILIVDSKSLIQFANPKACAIFEKSNEEIINTPLQIDLREPDSNEINITINNLNRTFDLYPAEIVWDDKPMTLVTLHEVTDRSAYIKRIDEQNKRYARAQAMGKVGNWEFTYSNNNLWISDETKRIFGLSTQDFLSLEMLSKKNILGKNTYSELIGYIERKENFSYIFDITPANQPTHKTLITKAEVEPTPDGQPAKMVGVVLDITERKMAEEAIRASELNFRTIFNSTNEAIFISDTNGKLLDVNIRAIEMYGFENKNEMLSKSIVDVSTNKYPYTDINAQQNIQKAITEGPQTFEWLAMKKNGDHLWVEVSLKYVEINKQERIISVIRDISTRKKSEKEFLRLNQEISAIFKASKPLQYLNTPEKLSYEIIHVLEDILNYEHCAVLLKDDDGVSLKPFAVSDQGKGKDFIEIDKNYIESKGIKVGKGIVGWVVKNGQSILINDVTKDTRYFSLRNDIRSEVCVPIISDSRVIGAINIESRLPNAYTETDLKILETMSAQIGIAIQNANLYQSAQKELNERKQVEQRLHKLNEELESKVEERTHAMEMQLEKLHKSQKAMLYMVEDLNEMTEELKNERQKLKTTNRELESFSYSVSHDLRAPLRAIDGFSKILEEDYAQSLDDEGKRLLNVVRTNSQKMDQLIIDLLALSRVTRGDIKLIPTDMTSLIHNIYKDVFVPTNPERVTLEVKSLPKTHADPTLIKQVWQNLIGNAIKYCRPENDIIIEVGGNVEDNMCKYYVKDNGIGFDPKYANKIFETFQRLHGPNDYEGTGIGLSIVMRIITRHGGTIWADGRPGQGATFWFTLPYIT
jgi:PAS domain S-box-containing protein